MEDLSRFKATYITECYELLEDMEDRLINLEEDSYDTEALNAIFRCAHSIKGGAGAFGFTEIATFTHTLEFLLDNMREGKLSATREIIDKILKAKDLLAQMVRSAEIGEKLALDFGHHLLDELKAIASGSGVHMASGTKAASSEPVQQSGDINIYNIKFAPKEPMFLSGNEPLLIFKELRNLGELEVSANTSALPSFTDLKPEHSYLKFNMTLESECGENDIRSAFEFVENEAEIEIELVGGLLRKPQNFKAVSTTKNENDNPTSAANKDQEQNNFSKKVGAASIRVDVDKIDKLVNMVGELVITQAMIQAQSRSLSFDEHSYLLNGVEELAAHTRELQESVMSIRMQPVKSIFSRMPRLVRDVSLKLGKDIRLDVSGENTEVDKTIIEQLTDPLTHMIRNSLDHGIETPEVRKANGKDPQGVIELKADQRGGKIVIEIVDDGAGINRERVLKKAIEKGIVNYGDDLTPEQIDSLIFHPGFSTADEVSDISGRGVGMDVVKRNIESIGGSVEVTNHPGEGVHFSVYIPLTLAILDGMIVGVADEKYIIPISNIIETLRPKPEEVKRIADDNDMINVRGNFIQVLYLYELFNIKGGQSDPSKALVVIIESGSLKYGLVVDELIGQQQVVIKSLDEMSTNIEGISGATILGDGKVSLILDTVRLPSLNSSLNYSKAA